MKKIHFFKAYSRIGLLNSPIGKNAPNIGVEDAPDAILTPDFLRSFGNSRVEKYSFTKPEEVKAGRFNQCLASELEGLSKLIDQTLDKDEIQVVIGGDHCITFSSLLSLLKRAEGKRIGYVQFDSHGDMNLAKDSPTNNFHGMYLRPFLDSFDIPEIAKLIGDLKLEPENMVYFGNLDLDQKEAEFFKKKGIRNFTPSQIQAATSEVEDWFKEFINRFDYLHLSIDIDAFDKTIAPATGIPAEQGLSFNKVDKLLTLASKHPNLSFDLAEINPKKEGAGITIELAQKIINILLS